MATKKKHTRGLLKPTKPFQEYMQETILLMESLKQLPEEEQYPIIRQHAEDDLFFFCVFILGMDFIYKEEVPVWDNEHDDYLYGQDGNRIMQERWFDYGYRLCYNVQKRKYGCMWIVAREHFKSMIITKASTLWEICKNPNETFCIYSYNTDIAKGFLGVIKKWIEDNKMLKKIWSDIFWEDPARGYEILPNGQKVTWTWTTEKIEVKRTRNSQEKTVEVGGLIGGQRTGYHFGKLIYDDAETVTTADTAESLDKIKYYYNMSANTGQTNNLQQCVIGTIYSLDDLYCMLEDRGDLQPIIQPCFELDGITPVRFDIHALMDKKATMSEFEWATQMLCNPNLGNMRAFKQEWIQRWDATNLRNLNIFMTVDPAGKVGRRRDYTAIWVGGVDALGNVMMIDLIRDKLTMEQKAKTVVSLFLTYHPKAVYYERVGMQSDIDYINMYQSMQNIRFPIFEMPAIGSKEARIDSATPMLSNMKVWFPESCLHKNWEGKVEDMLRSFFVDEYNRFPSCPHDDATDSLAMFLNNVINGTFEKPSLALQNGKTSLMVARRMQSDYDPMEYAKNH